MMKMDLIEIAHPFTQSNLEKLKLIVIFTLYGK
jgi:hypothetical protein